ncbi:hypothetical protein QRD02_05515 [Aequorivita sp. SDUM287046]|uniref:Outer membrane protein beta-barrel domain-containing protein n=1 Tax=Aequorivita aurantiaca TaxID=3053356 RepID=A0ABT8DIQ1_9FLAO|nr:hypothetical protein [Aequorivita aurantiaca]MDN3723831.1 hypothetical protein [Aequorivita aurantiaca]
MFLNIRLLFISLLISAASFAQQPETETQTETTQFPPNAGTKVGSITVGAYLPIAFGDNFVNEGMDLKMGAQVQLKLNVLGDFYIGPALSFFFADVTNRDLVGSYDEMSNLVLGGMVGYEKEVERFDLSIGLGVGYSGYFNEGLGDSFEDNATALWLRPEVSYKLANYVSLYVAPEFRHDFMNIDVPSELKDTFGGVNYFNFGFGLRINFGTGYKFQ